MAYYLPPELIAKLSTFKVKVENALHHYNESNNEDIYLEFERDNARSLDNVKLTLTLYSVVVSYEFRLHHSDTNLEYLVELRKHIIDKSKEEYGRRIGYVSDEFNDVIFNYNGSLRRDPFPDSPCEGESGKELKIELDIQGERYSYTNTINLDIPEHMLAVVDALIAYIEFAKKEEEKYRKWLLGRVM